MFTGIVQHVGRVAGARLAGEAASLNVDLGPLAAQTAVGDSVCVSGVCLTITDVSSSVARFDVGAETLRRTTLGTLRTGHEVNVELALRVGDRLGGHFVQGHVDGVGTLAERREPAGEVRLAVAAPAELTDQMIPKGSVAVDGVSLTIAALEPGRLEVSLIPHTLRATTLGAARPGDRVNIECDMIGRWVRRLVEGAASGAPRGLTMDDLLEQGF